MKCMYNKQPTAFSQMRFVAGSVVCAVAGALISLFQARLKERESFGLLHHAGNFYNL